MDSTVPLTICYWAGYLKSDITLDKIPNGIDVVILAFANPINSICNPRFLCSKYTETQIQNWISSVKKRGIKVLLSLIDRPEEHWNTVDIKTFIDTAFQLMQDWNLDGFDIDGESEMSSPDCIKYFSLLVSSLREKIGNKIITYTCYEGTSSPDGPILSNIHQQIDWIQTMDYFDSFEDIQNLFQDYSNIIPPEKIVIGVKAGSDFTHLDIVEKVCSWNKYKKGVMLWTINRDCPFYTNKMDFTWIHTIFNYLQIYFPNQYIYK